MKGRHSILPRAALALIALVMCHRLPTAAAHEVRPAFLELTERAPGEFDVLWKVPAMGGVPLAGEELPHEQPAAPIADLAGGTKTMPCGCPVPTAAYFGGGVLPIHPSLPQDARMIVPPRIERLFGAELRRWTIRTGDRGLDGSEIRVHGLEATMVDVLVRIVFADGRVVSRMLRPDAPAFTVEHGARSAAVDYLRLGVEHILLGIDHLLFVLALVLLVKDWKRLLGTITAFTVAHSLTLGLATLGYVNVPPAPVEAVIALSIVFVAAEILRAQGGGVEQSLTRRWPWIVAFSFGLLHGFGFAGALREVGLPPGSIPTALLFFNVGVELGQLFFISVVVAIITVAARAARNFSRRDVVQIPAFARWEKFAAYAIGGIAAFWLIQRTLSFTA